MPQLFKQHPIVVDATPAWWRPGPQCLVDGAEILAALNTSRAAERGLATWISEIRIRPDGVFLTCAAPDDLTPTALADERETLLASLDALHPERIPAPPAPPAPAAPVEPPAPAVGWVVTEEPTAPPAS